MQLNSLKPAEGSKKSKTRVGRGASSGKGKNCGFGHKGQKSRGRGKVAIGFEGGQMPFHRRVPKSGFNSWRQQFTAEIRLSSLNKLDGTVSLDTLKKAGLIPNMIKFAKVVLNGEVSKAVTIANDIKVTKGAKAAIEAAGGKVEE